MQQNPHSVILNLFQNLEWGFISHSKTNSSHLSADCRKSYYVIPSHRNGFSIM